jgi:hypothetical protein
MQLEGFRGERDCERGMEWEIRRESASVRVDRSFCFLQLWLVWFLRGGCFCLDRLGRSDLRWREEGSGGVIRAGLSVRERFPPTFE